MAPGKTAVRKTSKGLGRPLLTPKGNKGRVSARAFVAPKAAPRTLSPTGARYVAPGGGARNNLKLIASTQSASTKLHETAAPNAFATPEGSSAGGLFPFFLSSSSANALTHQAVALLAVGPGMLPIISFLAMQSLPPAPRTVTLELSNGLTTEVSVVIDPQTGRVKEFAMDIDDPNIIGFDDAALAESTTPFSDAGVDVDYGGWYAHDRTDYPGSLHIRMQDLNQAIATGQIVIEVGADGVAEIVSPNDAMFQGPYNSALSHAVP